MADAALILHLAFIGWVIFGALFTRGRPRFALVHVASVAYGIISETTPLVCPLTLAENYFEARAKPGKRDAPAADVPWCARLERDASAGYWPI